MKFAKLTEVQKIDLQWYAQEYKDEHRRAGHSHVLHLITEGLNADQEPPSHKLWDFARWNGANWSWHAKLKMGRT